ncbi:MAG TPA: hypothetical protein VND64_23010, partial [Pirellulales bacterium]|nr:hypothetical protein [Pirellulales bacterium]
INKVLYQPQATMSLGAALTQLATYERLYFLDPRDELLRRDYASKIASIEPDQPEDDAGFKFARMVKNRAEDLEDLLRNLKN